MRRPNVWLAIAAVSLFNQGCGEAASDAPGVNSAAAGKSESVGVSGGAAGAGGGPAGSVNGPTLGRGGSGAANGGAFGAAPSLGSAASAAISGAGGSSSAEGGTTAGGAGALTAGSSNFAGSASAGASHQVEYWIAPSGDDTNPGSRAAPLATVTAALSKVAPGVTLWLEPGSYASDVTLEIGLKYSGVEGKPVTLRAVPGARPVLDFSSQPRDMSSVRGINLAADYWRIQGLELKRASDNCIAIAGSHNVIEDVIVHECGDTGIQITAPGSQATDNTRAAYNSIVNCDSWGNLDQATGGENADGFAAKLRIGPGNLFKGCRAWNNADDGWDLFAADDVVTIDSSWAFSNGKPIGGSNPQGDGNGFKLGGAPNGAGQGGAVHVVTGSFAFENKACGFVRNNNPELPIVKGCGAKDNKTAYCSLTVTGEVSMSMTAAAAIAAPRSSDGSLPAMK